MLVNKHVLSKVVSNNKTRLIIRRNLGLSKHLVISNYRHSNLEKFTFRVIIQWNLNQIIWKNIFTYFEMLEMFLLRDTRDGYNRYVWVTLERKFFDNFFEIFVFNVNGHLLLSIITISVKVVHYMLTVIPNKFTYYIKTSCISKTFTSHMSNY